jgi:hypothetical protein
MTVGEVGLVSKPVGNISNQEYSKYLDRLQQRFIANTENFALPLFTTDCGDLWNVYLSSFSNLADRQYHNCNECRRFIQRFGGLVTIDEKGKTKSAFWDVADAPEHYKKAVSWMVEQVEKAKVSGVFIHDEPNLGVPRTGEWTHLSLKLDRKAIHKSLVESAFQASAKKLEDHKNMAHALTCFPPVLVKQALTLLETDSLYRSEKVYGPAKFLDDLHTAQKGKRGRFRDNVLWRMIATAPDGFLHPRSSMIGTLLEDMEKGMKFELVARRFAEKMHPLRHQRPQAAPSAGTVAQAEKIFDKLDAAGSLKRRFATVDEINALWRPRPVKKPQKSSGIFKDIETKEDRSISPKVQQAVIPPVVMTFRKFRETVLPKAEKIELYVGTGKENFCVYVTAQDPMSPPILQWDEEEFRNQVSWYGWHGGATAAQYGLKGGRYHDVSAISLKPTMWNGEDRYSHFSKGALFCLEGSHETRNGGLALFPSFMRSEFHGIRSVIEAHSNRNQISRMDRSSASGIMINDGGNFNLQLRVTVDNIAVVYKLDRWD